MKKAGKSGREKLMLRPQTRQKNSVGHFKWLRWFYGFDFDCSSREN